MRIWVRMPRILGRSFKQECRYIGTSNWITSLIHGSTFGKKNIGSQLKGEKIGVASMTNNNTARSNRVTVAMRNSHRMSWLVSFWDAFRNYWIRLRSTLAKRWHSTSHGCNIQHHTWCFYRCPGLVLFVPVLANHDFLHPLRPLFSIVVMIWTFIVLLNWKKRTNLPAYRWGTLNYKAQETTRPQFKGDYVQDEITGE